MKNSTVPRGLSMAGFNEYHLSMLRAEIEMLAVNETHLKKVAGAAVLFMSRLELGALPEAAIIPAATLDNFINQMPGNLKMEVLQLVRNQGDK
jgi:hypothetical protein